MLPPGALPAADGLVVHLMNKEVEDDCAMSAVGAAGWSGGATTAAERGFELAEDPFAFLPKADFRIPFEGIPFGLWQLWLPGKIERATPPRDSGPWLLIFPTRALAL